MAAVYRLKGLGWLASGTVVALSFYIVSSQVAAERKKLDTIDARIASARRDIRALETEFDVRANLVQLERWNGDTLSLTVPTASQFVHNEAALAALSPEMGAGAGTRTAALIVPARPTTAVAALTPVSVPAVPAAVPADKPRKPAAPPARVTLAAAHVSATPRGEKATTARVQAAVAQVPASATRARNIRAVAMLDRSLVSETTLNDLLAHARSERSRLR